MASTKPSILIIPGAWHTPNSYAALREGLEAEGFDVHVPALPTTNGTRPPTADLYTDIDSIRSYAESLMEGRAVIALMHSYGGLIGSNALHGLSVESRKEKGLSGGISHLIYMAAYALFEGKSIADKAKEFQVDEEVLAQLLDFADDQTCVIRDPKPMLLGEEVNDAQAQPYLQTLTRWNGKALSQGAKQAAWREMPVTYISCTKDMTAPYDWQKSMIEGMKNEGRNVKVLQWETTHCPHITMTKEVMDLVNEIAHAI